jgi:anti-anti-sigma factor
MEDQFGQFRLKVGGARVTAAGELDANTCTVLASAIEAAPDRHVVVDLRDVDFIDSSGLRCLTDQQRRRREHGGSLRVVPSRAVTRVVEMAGLADVLHLVDETGTITGDAGSDDGVG